MQESFSNWKWLRSCLRWKSTHKSKRWASLQSFDYNYMLLPDDIRSEQVDVISQFWLFACILVPPGMGIFLEIQQFFIKTMFSNMLRISFFCPQIFYKTLKESIAIDKNMFRLKTRSFFVLFSHATSNSLSNLFCTVSCLSWAKVEQVQLNRIYQSW